MKRIALAATVALIAAACTSSASGCRTVDSAGPLPLHLYVSNQSFDIDPVDIVVFIDEIQVVCQDFHVEGQHNWVLFDLGLDPGHHLLRAVGNRGTVIFEEEFDLEDERWAVLDFWFYPDEEPEGFSFSIHDGPVGFA